MAAPGAKRSDYEIASQIASVIEAAAISKGPSILAHPESCVALNVFGQGGFSIWAGPPPEPRATVPLAPLPELRAVLSAFKLASEPGLPAEVSGQILAALLPRAIDQLAIAIWDEFLALKQRLGITT